MVQYARCYGTEYPVGFSMQKIPNASVFGSIMYAMVCIYPDIVHIVHAAGVVSWFMSNPGKEHWKAVKWILKYLRGTTKRANELSWRVILMQTQHQVILTKAEVQLGMYLLWVVNSHGLVVSIVFLGWLIDYLSIGISRAFAIRTLLIRQLRFSLENWSVYMVFQGFVRSLWSKLVWVSGTKFRMSSACPPNGWLDGGSEPLS